MFTTPPATPLSTGLSTGPGTGRNSGRSRGRHTVALAAGSTYVPVDFTNTSGSPCGLYGYPGMSFVTAGDGSGSQIGAAAQENPSFGKVPVQLAAGGAAHAWLQVAEAGNYPATTCQPVTAHWLRVYAPGETQALYVSHAFN